MRLKLHSRLTAVNPDAPFRPVYSTSALRCHQSFFITEALPAHEAYLHEAGIKPLIETAMGVQSLREDRDGETEFVTISYWDSIEAMTRFTGGDPTRIRHLKRDSEFLIELPQQVQILRIKASHGQHRRRRHD